jgi:hypothetical protein
MEPAAPHADWEAFYRDYRKPGYVSGFEITSKLGGGAFGLVFRAKRTSIGKDYAIKFLHVEDAAVRQAVRNELEQVQLFAQIDHPNLVSIEDRGEVDGIPYLVMAFAGSETLRDKLPGRVPSASEKDELLRWFLQACRGLQALHDRSLVHFDVKPANVFVKGSVARLGDYGLSKLVTHSRGSLSMGRGTPYYMAPELLQRRGDHRSDIYSLGVLLYELLCGAVPFRGDSEWEVLKAHESREPEWPGHLLPHERAILQRCLAKDPAQRCQNVHEVISAFAQPIAPMASRMANAAARTEVPSVATLPSCTLPPALPAPVRRRRLLVPGIIVLMLLGGTASALFAAERMVRRQLGPVYAGATAPQTPQPARAARDAREPQLARQYDQLVASLGQKVKSAVQRERRPALVELDTERFGAVADVGACVDLVKSLVRAPMFSPTQASLLQQCGRAAFVAAVAYLQDLDYEDADDCRSAVFVQRVLGSFVAAAPLVLEPIVGEPCEAEICRFAAVADGWRQIADRFAKSDAAFAALRAVRSGALR